MSGLPRFTLGKTTMGQISRSELKEIFKRLETEPKRSIREINRKKMQGGNTQ